MDFLNVVSNLKAIVFNLYFLLNINLFYIYFFSLESYRNVTFCFLGHSLKQLDLEFLFRIQDKVNVIPVIAKADTLTAEECREFKKIILNDLIFHKIRVFEFPDHLECSGNF